MSADVEVPQYMKSKGSGLAESWKAYRIKVRSGDMGSLPAVIGLVVLVALFSLVNPVFFTYFTANSSALSSNWRPKEFVIAGFTA